MSFRLTTLLAGLAATFAVHAVEPDFAYFVDKHPQPVIDLLDFLAQMGIFACVQRKQLSGQLRQCLIRRDPLK